jgi:hypothetical protein
MLWLEKVCGNRNRLSLDFKARGTGEGLYMGHAQGRTLYYAMQSALATRVARRGRKSRIQGDLTNSRGTSKAADTS